MSSFFVNSFFPFTIKKWDQLHTDLRNEPDFTLFKIKLKEKLKPMKFRHFHVGFKYPKTIHTQLTLLNAGGGGIRPPYHINVVPRKMLKEKVANFL